MAENNDIPQKQIDDLYEKLDREAEESGYHLNPDEEFTKELVKGLITNEKRYGYPACPCRLAEGDKIEDLDIICPCDYRDADLNDYDACYCALYVTQEVVEGKKEAASIPERRPPREERSQIKRQKPAQSASELPYTVWRCKVCGYLCAREQPPQVCPVCFAKKDRFEVFIRSK